MSTLRRVRAGLAAATLFTSGPLAVASPAHAVAASDSLICSYIGDYYIFATWDGTHTTRGKIRFNLPRQVDPPWSTHFHKLVGPGPRRHHHSQLRRSATTSVATTHLTDRPPRRYCPKKPISEKV